MALGAVYGRSIGDSGGLTSAYDGGGLLTPNGIGLTGAYGGGRESELVGQTLGLHQLFVGAETLAEAQKRGPILTYTRADAVATRFNSSGILETLGTDAPRFDHSVNNGNPLGILSELLSINRLLHNRDFSNAVWVKSDITAVKDATGLDAVASSASTLTATAANGTALQTITIASAARTFTVYVKRKTGVGDVDITQNGGAAWTTLTGLSSSKWTRHKLTATQLNPVIGFRIVVDTDAIEVDYGQFETGTIFSSPIATAAAGITRQKDLLLTADMTWLTPDVAGTVLVHASQPDPTTSTTLYTLSDGTSSNRWLQLVSASGRAQWVVVSTRGASVVNTIGTVDWAAGVAKKLIIAQGFLDDATMHEDGLQVATDSSNDLPENLDKFTVGSDQADGNQFGGHIREFKYWNALKTPAFLAAITA